MEVIFTVLNFGQTQIVTFTVFSFGHLYSVILNSVILTSLICFGNICIERERAPFFKNCRIYLIIGRKSISETQMIISIKSQNYTFNWCHFWGFETKCREKRRQFLKFAVAINYKLFGILLGLK